MCWDLLSVLGKDEWPKQTDNHLLVENSIECWVGGQAGNNEDLKCGCQGTRSLRK